MISVKVKQRFAWWPTKMDDDSYVFLAHYLEKHVKVDTESFIVREKISNDDKRSINGTEYHRARGK